MERHPEPFKGGCGRTPREVEAEGYAILWLFTFGIVAGIGAGIVCLVNWLVSSVPQP